MANGQFRDLRPPDVSFRGNEVTVGIRSLLAARRRRAPLGRKELRIVPEGNALGVPRRLRLLAMTRKKEGLNPPLQYISKTDR